MKDAQVYDGAVSNGSRAADGTSWFVFSLTNANEVVSAKWMTSGLGVYEIYLNGRPVGDDFLKPGFTHNAKTKYAFTYDVLGQFATEAGATNVFAAEVSAGWWRDKIVTPCNKGGGFFGRKSAFRGVLELIFADGSRRLYGTNAKDWRAGIGGPVTHAAIFDGEEYDARQKPAYLRLSELREPEINEEFKGKILPTAGAEVCLRHDRAMDPVAAYVWTSVTNAGEKAFGTIAKTKTYACGEKMMVLPGENLVLDFGQNAAAVPFFHFRAAPGTVMTALPAEMLNDGNGVWSRGCDGPAGSIYRVNLREGHENGRLIRYTFASSEIETYNPRFTYFGYRYISISASAPVEIEIVRSVPVSSVRREMELGRIETGDAAINRLIANAYWGQLSNYLSVPTDCPQRNERLGWTADTQVFAEAGAFNADTSSFFRKWMRDMRDSQDAKGGFPSVAPFGQYGNERMRLGWADAGVIVPYRVWCQFGDTRIVRENWDAMKRFFAHVEETKYAFHTLPECGAYQYADWLSFEDYDTADGRAWIPGKGWGHPLPEAVEYWDFLGACYWLLDARMLGRMAESVGEVEDRKRFEESEVKALRYIQDRFVDQTDGLLIKSFRHLQGAMLFALHCGVFGGCAREATKSALRESFINRKFCPATGFLGTSIMMDTLTENGLADLAYDILLHHGFPGWLYSVDQGATTIWERWNSYTRDEGFGPVVMNSFNHYAYGSVIAWIYKTAAGIAADPSSPGFKNIIMAPHPDRRLGHVSAEYRSVAGLVKSAWRYEGEKWLWEFTIPEGATASVTLPGETKPMRYAAGSHRVSLVSRDGVRSDLLYISHVHRGGGLKERPDNTLETFKWCWENGSALECDCRRTKDGVGIMLHDDQLLRTSRGISDELARKSVSEELTWAEIKDVDVGSYLNAGFSHHRIPTIGETFATMKGHPTWLCFIDDKGAGPNYIAEAARKAGVIGQVYYSGPSYEGAVEWMRNVPNGKTMLWIGTWPVPQPEHTEADLARFEAYYEKIMEKIRMGGYKGVSVVSLHSYYNPEAKEPFVPRARYLMKLVEELHAHGIPVCSIPFAGGESEESYFKLWELGFDGFSSDYPSVMFRVIHALKTK